MVFLFRFDGPTRAPTASTSILAWPEVVASQDVAIMRACEMLASTDARFLVSGFGQDDWNLDVRYDLSIFLEQVPNSFREMHAENEFEISMYSQGVERSLIFHPQGSKIRIECISGTSWRPDPAEEELTGQALWSMFTRLASDFSRAVKVLDEDAAGIEPFRDWLRGVFQ